MSMAQEGEGVLADPRRPAGDCTEGEPPQRARSAFARVSGFVQLSRPFTMVAAFVAGLSIVVLYSRHYGMGRRRYLLLLPQPLALGTTLPGRVG